MTASNPINPIFDLQFSDLYQLSGLKKINQTFLEFLSDANNEFYQKYTALILQNKVLEGDDLVEIAKIFEDFLELFFNIKLQNKALQSQHHELNNLYVVKRLFVQRKVAKKFKSFEGTPPNKYFDELELANQISICLQDEEKYQEKLEELEQYCAFALFHADGIKHHKNGVLFKIPKKIDFDNLVDLKDVDGVKKAADEHLKNRDGFKLTDSGASLIQTLSETNYCIYCHKQGKDSCKTGLKEKSPTQILSATNWESSKGGGGVEFSKKIKDQNSISLQNNEEPLRIEENIFKINPLKAELSGCPLEEKISEMNILKNDGFSIATLAVVTIDNPMVAGTGHRICNDCMKSCIYQKQEPVDIPQIETRTLKDVLDLPFGFEIYSLLTRWNPLNTKSPLPKDPSGKKVMVAGLGPAGYTLAHYLLNEGHLVVGVDGLKIEPLDPQISGIDLSGNRHQFCAIEDVNEIYEDLDKRTLGGFGGVAEYGITVRWNKNFLKIIRLLLERREYFRMFGGFRLGSALDCYDALKNEDFDHVALCLGAGWAKIPEIENNLLKGIRMASDFLMALQLTGAERFDLPSNLQVRLPVLVVGSGLTAIDTATEALAYYPKQVENFSNHYKFLCEKLGKNEVEKNWSQEDHLIAQEFLEHFKLISQARNSLSNINKTDKTSQSVIQVLKKLGGAKIIYRKALKDSPAYRLNHEEVQKAFEEGIEFIENVTPIKAIDDGFGHIKALLLKDLNDKEILLPARATFLAAGTTPNKAPFYEDKLKFELDGSTFQIIDLLGEKLPAVNSPKGDGIGFICAKNEEEKAVSFFGDLHPSFNGSVVKAMASAKNGYPIINQALKLLNKSEFSNNLETQELLAKNKYEEFLNKINTEFATKVKEVNILSDYFTELVVYAPLLAKKTKLGHIFRLHNYNSLADKKDRLTLTMEGIAVTTYKVDPEKGTISVIIVNAGGSSSLVKNLKVGESIIFMGPSGSPNHIAKDKNITLIAGGRGIFPLASLAAEHKKNGCNVTLFCGFKKVEDLVRKKELEESCDNLIISFEEGDAREFFKGNIIDAVKNHFKNNAEKIDTLLTMGSDQMMHKVAELYHSDLKINLNESSIGITSLNSPMQCMLKGVCSQCLQRKIDTKTGKERFFYACVGQDQKLSEIDFDFLKNRCGQNSLPEKITKLMIDSVDE